MEIQSMLLLFLCALVVLLSSSSTALDTIYANQAIKDDGNTIVSLGGTFELGFFSPGKSKNRYVGIWYKNISVCTPVWVANREMPIADKSGMFKVSQDGKPIIIFSTGVKTKIWSSNSASWTINPIAQILDTGNLVLWDNSTTKQKLIWQSYDYPGDTLLPAMKLGKDLVTGLEWSMTSWKSPDDPSQGEYLQWMDTNGYPQMFGKKGKVLHARTGPWNGLGFSGLPIDTPNSIYSIEFVVNENEIYHRVQLNSPVIKYRIQLTWEGKILQMLWIERIQKWAVYGDVGVDICNNRYGLCGSYGSCNINRRPLCSCIGGFEPRLPDEWEASDWSSGCQRKKHLDCKSGDGFQKINIRSETSRHTTFMVQWEHDSWRLRDGLQRELLLYSLRKFRH